MDTGMYVLTVFQQRDHWRQILVKTGYFEGTLGYSDDKYDTEIGSAPTYNRADIFGPDGKVVMAKVPGIPLPIIIPYIMISIII